jgi:hypothetical protein
LIKLPRKVILAMAIILIVLVGLTFYLQYNSANSTGPWTSTTPYPLETGGNAGVLGQSCVASSSTVYCIGGEDVNSSPHDSVYYAPISSSGIGNWTLDQYPYPKDIMFTSCLTSSGYVYCVGGTYMSSGNDTTATYFAPIEGSGLGNWTATSPYPVPMDSESCVPASGYVFCMGGENETSGTSASATDSASVWYASLSSSGIGSWSRTTAYPSGAFFPDCSSLGGYIYCVGGEDSSSNVISSSYYASVSPDGLGAWTASTPYPIQDTDQSCVVTGTVLYCVGGLATGGSSTSNVYYAGLSPSGIGAWQQGGGYPSALSTDCVASPTYVYCTGGYDPSSGPSADSFFAPVAASTTAASSASG